MAKHQVLNDADEHTVDSALAAWTAVLDGLEAAVGAAEGALHNPLVRLSAGANSSVTSQGTGWAPPALTTPLPPELRARAMDLAAKQEGVTQRLEEARLDAARQLQAVSSVPGIGEPAKAVYLDVKG